MRSDNSKFYFMLSPKNCSQVTKHISIFVCIKEIKKKKQNKLKCLTGIVIGSYDDRVLTSSVLFVYDLKIENNLPSINK